MNLYELQTPMQWKAGYIGSGADKKPFYFHCGYCGAEDAVIHAFIGPTPNESSPRKREAWWMAEGPKAQEIAEG